MKMDLCDCVTGFLFSERGLPATMCDSGVSLTSCTEDAGLDTSDCDSPTGKGGHTVTIQVSNTLQKHDKLNRSEREMLDKIYVCRSRWKQTCKYFVNFWAFEFE